MGVRETPRPPTGAEQMVMAEKTEGQGNTVPCRQPRRPPGALPRERELVKIKTRPRARPPPPPGRGARERTTTDGGAWHLGPAYGPHGQGCLPSGRRRPSSIYPVFLTRVHHPLLHGCQEGAGIAKRDHQRDKAKEIKKQRQTRNTKETGLAIVQSSASTQPYRKRKRAFEQTRPRPCGAPAFALAPGRGYN